jgi:hypothetical protein
LSVLAFGFGADLYPVAKPLPIDVTEDESGVMIVSESAAAHDASFVQLYRPSFGQLASAFQPEIVAKNGHEDCDGSQALLPID